MGWLKRRTSAVPPFIRFADRRMSGVVVTKESVSGGGSLIVTWKRGLACKLCGAQYASEFGVKERPQGPYCRPCWLNQREAMLAIIDVGESLQDAIAALRERLS